LYISPEELSRVADVDAAAIRRIDAEFPLRINPYYFSIIKSAGEALWKQAIPDAGELISILRQRRGGPAEGL
jgi:hypothetical protein